MSSSLFVICLSRDALMVRTAEDRVTVLNFLKYICFPL